MYTQQGTISSNDFVPFEGGQGTSDFDSIGWYRPFTLTVGNMGAWPVVSRAWDITTVKATLATASINTLTTVDILKSSDNGSTFTSIFSTKLTIDIAEQTSMTAGTPHVFSLASLAVDDILKANIDTAGGGAADLSVSLHLSRTSA